MKNVFPPLPDEIIKLEDAMVQLINDGVCTQEDLFNLARFSQRISNAETDRRRKMHIKYEPWCCCVPPNRTK